MVVFKQNHPANGTHQLVIEDLTYSWILFVPFFPFCFPICCGWRSTHSHLLFTKMPSIHHLSVTKNEPINYHSPPLDLLDRGLPSAKFSPEIHAPCRARLPNSSRPNAPRPFDDFRGWSYGDEGVKTLKTVKTCTVSICDIRHDHSYPFISIHIHSYPFIHFIHFMLPQKSGVVNWTRAFSLFLGWHDR